MVLCFAPTILLVRHLFTFDIAHDLYPPSVKFSRGRGTEEASAFSIRVTKEKRNDMHRGRDKTKRDGTMG